jgi:hypothetical protein
MEKLYQKIPAKLIEYLYLAAFSLVLLYDYDFLTQFDRQPFRLLYIIGAGLGCIVLIIRFLNVRNEDLPSILAAIALLFVGGGYFLFRHSFYFLVLAILIVGARYVKAKKLLTLYVVVAGTFFAIMVTHFLLTTPYDTWKNMTGVHFGSINTTDCQGMLFFLIVAYLFIREDKISYIGLLLLAGAVLLLWYYTKAEFNMYCSLACILVAAGMKLVLLKEKGHKKSRRKNLRQVYHVMAYCFLLCAAIMMLLIMLYDTNDAKWISLDNHLHHRLAVASKVMDQYPPCLWGRDYDAIGWGITPGVVRTRVEVLENYSFIDSSYPNVLVMHGYLVLAMILGVMTCVSYRYAQREKLYYLLLLMLLAVDFAAENHMKELACNVWLLLPFAELSAADDVHVQQKRGPGSAP